MAVSSATAIPGVGGFDYSTLLNNLADLEQQRLTPYTTSQSTCKNKISAWGTISSLMTTLQGTVKKLENSAFNTMKVSETTAFTATATDSANADTHSVRVDQLAVAHKLKTATFDSSDKALGSQDGGTRTLTITQKDGASVQVELKDEQTSLNDIAKAINDKGGDVSASVQRTGDGQYQLMLSSKKTGEDGEMTVSVEGDEQLGALFNTSNGGTGNDKMTQVSAAQDAKVTVDGTQYTRSINNISDIIDGVTLNLNAVSKDDTPEQLTLSVDTSAIKTTLQDFVKQYNALLSEASAESKFVPLDTSSSSTEKSGVLMGDSTLRSLVSGFRNAVASTYGDTGSDYSSLADLGISIDTQNGQMTLDEDKLDKAIADNSDQIGKIFKGSGETAGLASSLESIITKFAGDEGDGKTSGMIKTTTDDLNTQLTDIGDQITKTQVLIDSQVELYRKQFANADLIVNQTNNLQNTLATMFSQL
ncbi:flagellar hook-associated protein 2 [Kosakonia arachidis]|uniref:Flagellar hook-associated protein 2 n=1 Tax=Kosakonia arachidis TaxID=551989 RepID=A0A1I7E8H7_9ENTR|nr:flagellar filament capping protein FliD [Kosakonia arachidis]SFU20185.1 flagellar hook-associated protein 2 [Kosakonia arachidis]